MGLGFKLQVLRVRFRVQISGPGVPGSVLLGTWRRSLGIWRSKLRRRPRSITPASCFPRPSYLPPSLPPSSLLLLSPPILAASLPQVSEFAVSALLVLLEDAARPHLDAVRAQFPNLRTHLQARLEELGAGVEVVEPGEEAREEADVPSEVEETRRLLALLSHGRRSEPPQRRPQSARGSPGHRSKGRRSAR